MRIRLSQRGWNNVLIFACLFLIMLFNSTEQIFSEKEPEAIQPLLPANSLIQSINFNGIKFERIGSSWRVLTQITLSQELIAEDYIQHWHQAEFGIINQPEHYKSAAMFPVIVWLAGESKGLVYEFFISQQDQQYYLYNPSVQQWQQLAPSQLPKLIPDILLSM